MPRSISTQTSGFAKNKQGVLDDLKKLQQFEPLVDKYAELQNGTVLAEGKNIYNTLINVDIPQLVQENRFESAMILNYVLRDFIYIDYNPSNPDQPIHNMNDHKNEKSAFTKIIIDIGNKLSALNQSSLSVDTHINAVAAPSSDAFKQAKKDALDQFKAIAQYESFVQKNVIANDIWFTAPQSMFHIMLNSDIPQLIQENRFYTAELLAHVMHDVLSNSFKMLYAKHDHSFYSAADKFVPEYTTGMFDLLNLETMMTKYQHDTSSDYHVV